MLRQTETITQTKIDITSQPQIQGPHFGALLLFRETE